MKGIRIASKCVCTAFVIADLCPVSQSTFTLYSTEGQSPSELRKCLTLSFITVLLAHLLALVWLGAWQGLVSHTLRMYTTEVVGLSLSLWAFTGLVILIMRRISDSRLRALTSKMDVVLFVFLLWQVGPGMYIALFHRWGPQWFTTIAVPWIHSLLVLQPQHEMVSSLSWVVKVHMLGGFILLALFPFTRLVHVVSFPLPYLWRPYQVVRWYRERKRTVESPESASRVDYL